VKFITRTGPAGPARERFLTEVRAIARLSHPNVVTIYTAGEVDGHPFLVSELVRGQTLAELQKPVPWEEALRIGQALCRGVAAAHRQGVLHRDIKPGNLMLQHDGEVKILDFGLATLFEPDASHGAADGMLVGTPR